MTTTTQSTTTIKHLSGSMYSANGMTVVMHWTATETAHPRLMATVIIDEDGTQRMELHTLNQEETRAVWSNTEHHREYAAKYHDMIS